MNLLIQHSDGQITQLTFATVIAHLLAPVAIATDPARVAAYLTANAGQTVPESVYEKQTAIQEERLLVLTADGAFSIYPVTTLLLKASKFSNTTLIDLAQHWRTGKYTVTGATVAHNPHWTEPTITLPPPTPPNP